jgi:hypothetical protein
MEPDQGRKRDGLLRRLTARTGASTDRWQIAKRAVYVILLGASFLIFYLLSSLEQALELLQP